MRALTPIGGLFAAATLTIATTVTGTAVVGGTLDTENRYANVGPCSSRMQASGSTTAQAPWSRQTS